MVFCATNNKLPVLAIFIDFAKAFGTVNHRILLNEMHQYWNSWSNTFMVQTLFKKPTTLHRFQQ